MTTTREDWTEEDFYLAMLAWKKILTKEQVLRLNPKMKKGSLDARIMQYEYKYQGRLFQKNGEIRKLKPMGEQIFNRYKDYKFHKNDDDEVSLEDLSWGKEDEFQSLKKLVTIWFWIVFYLLVLTYLCG